MFARLAKPPLATTATGVGLALASVGATFVAFQLDDARPAFTTFLVALVFALSSAAATLVRLWRSDPGGVGLAMGVGALLVCAANTLFSLWVLSVLAMAAFG